MPGARGLSQDQAGAVTEIATSTRRLDVLVGPAGSGKTRTLRALRAAWERQHGPGSVMGLAPSATAAAELSAALVVVCENTAKWMHETDQQAREIDGVGSRWAIHPGQLVIVDEASMVTTTDLDRLLGQAQTAGAKLLLVGDDQQLDAVGAGGAFSLLAETSRAQVLSSLWRFRNRWEAHATRGLRLGDPAALDAYAENGRLTSGPVELMLDAAYAAWINDMNAGRSAVLLAADRATVTALNARAHSDRVATGAAHEDGIVFADDSTGGRGDIVVTRRNFRSLSDHDGYVRNGDLWQVAGVHADGSIDVNRIDCDRPAPEHTPDAGENQQTSTIRLPADYVRDHVELGYATTVHRAQGTTVDRGHVVASPGMTRQSFYVAMTRGREANHAYVATDTGINTADGTCPAPTGGGAPTGNDVLRSILAADRAELSATATLRRRQTEATSLRRLLPIREFLAKATEDPECAAAVGEINALLRARAVAARAESERRRPQHTAHHVANREGLRS